ncbi:MAG: riboflavin synthase [Pseudomonadota bacterium]
MFTGIVTDVGSVEVVEARGDKRFVIKTAYDMDEVDIGASIACSGVCLTVVEKDKHSFAVDVSAESLSRSVLGDWVEGSKVNLERSLKLGDEMGGHIVSGHVDGIGWVAAMTPEGDSVRYDFAVPDSLARFIAEKGSIAVDGVSLTVNRVWVEDGEHRFGVNIIPHTQAVTTFGAYKVGDRVNLEIDMLARYVARLADVAAAAE